MFKIGLQRYTRDTTVTVNVGVRMATSAARKGTMETGVIRKRMDWVEGSGQRVTGE